jgi:hypothetical protein
MEHLHMSKQSKFMSIAIVILAIALFVSISKINESKDERQRQYEIFINHFYFSITDSLDTLDRIIEFHDLPSVRDNLEDELNRFREQMQKADYILFYANVFNNNDIHYFRYFSHMNFMTDGLQSSSNNRDPVIVPPFAEDGVIDETELAVLKWIKEDLDTLQQSLYSEERKQEDPNITIEQFNEIVMPIVAKSYTELANRYNVEIKKLTKD